ncbi:MAG TPA: hypothetical protein VFJ19_10520 [Nocardioidaceae bacterium]|nr:hypothetical protein [Nocardioidaceae bacterium]
MSDFAAEVPLPDSTGTDTSALAPTGVPAVDEAVAGLDVLDTLSVEEHVAVLESAHARLRSALADVGDADA